ncbi:myosin-binding protein 3-like isoform X2 [Phragmites australis]|uniref:myosin-binding protein 3-like isoform X2 n=1 Tax=Phragmites australis TaxID=29695 RepID=UPI002D78B759|nr:myosin-binding protein 3-like isoform X2 [Phragmites australis]
MGSEAPMAGANLTAALCKKSNRIARVLSYALLEWILIALLLANSVFFYLISRFAAFFALAPPCALCSRLGVDSLFEPHRRQGIGAGGGAEPLRRVLCDAHATEVSRLGYCRAHRRLADAGDMCEDCAGAAAPGKALLSWMGRSELGERDLACACCGVALESGFYSPPFLLPMPALCDSDCCRKEEGTASLNGDVVFVSVEGPVLELFDEKPLVEDDSIGVMAQDAKIVGNVERLVPPESIDSLAVGMAAVSSQSGGERKEAVDHGAVRRNDLVPENTVNANEEKLVMTSDDEKVNSVLDRPIDEQIAAVVLAPSCMESTFDDGINADETVENFADQQSPEEDSGVKDQDLKISIGNEISEDEQVEQAVLKEELYTMSQDPKDHEFVEKLYRSTEVENFQQAELKHKLDSIPMEAAVHVAASSEEKQVQQAELNQELDSIPICPRKHADEELEWGRTAQAGLEQEWDSVPIDSGEHVCVTSYAHADDEQAEVEQKSTSVRADVLEYVADNFDDNTNTGKDIEEDSTEASLHKISYEPLTSLDKLSPDHSFVEEERASDTPTHIEDSSVVIMSPDLESTELVSVDQLKSALAAARKSLNMLYAELENERNAAAISADETMAMINRLQEQKAAMQMEAIQYQRLMEEQSEYDQEALQRLNELVVKREKEKQDLERELELYRHKVHLYESKVRKMSRHKSDDQNGSSSASSSAEDSDDLSQSFYEGDESAHGLNGSNGSIPTDVVLQETARNLVALDGSLADFEEERLSILEQLQVLEDRLFDLDDEESDNTKMDKHFSEENHLSGASNGFSDDDSCFKLHDKRKGVSYRGKKLLPLFDDATVEAGNILLTKQGDEADHSTEVIFELARGQDKLAIANEINQVHERLHALEADRDFIKQCVRSLKRGGKGFDLLQDILQHLRDLRRIEQRARNSGELSPHYLHPYTV